MDAALKVRWQAGAPMNHGEVMAVHKVTFLPLNVTVEVDDEKYPLADHGKPKPCSTSRWRPHSSGAQLRQEAARARRVTSS